VSPTSEVGRVFENSIQPAPQGRKNTAARHVWRSPPTTLRPFADQPASSSGNRKRTGPRAPCLALRLIMNTDLTSAAAQGFLKHNSPAFAAVVCTPLPSRGVYFEVLANGGGHRRSTHPEELGGGSGCPCRLPLAQTRLTRWSGSGVSDVCLWLRPGSMGSSAE